MNRTDEPWQVSRAADLTQQRSALLLLLAVPVSFKKDVPKYPLDDADDLQDALSALEALNGLSIKAQRWRGGYRQGHRSWRPAWWA